MSTSLQSLARARSGWVAILRLLPVAVAAVIGAQNGLQITLTRYLADKVPPATLALGRYVVALVLLGPLALATIRFRLRLRDLAPIGFLGVLNFGVMIAVQNHALLFLPSGRGALIFATFPFFTLLFSTVLGFERMSLAKLIGVLLTVVGVAMVLGDKVLASSGLAADWRGEALMLASAVLAAACSTYYRPYVQRYPALAVGSFAILCADAALLPAMAAEGPSASLAALSVVGWLAIVVVGVMSAVFYWLWLWTLGRMAPTRVTVFHALSPATAAVAGAVFLGEPMAATFLLGLATVIAGFVVAYRREP
jgi:drug/metabolite transporter (DMT)-like permease